MTELTFVKATKAQSKLRLAIFGPAGAGKTYSALAIAKGIGGSIGLIDTEYGSASKYSDRFEFNTLILQKPSVSTMVKAINSAAGFDTLIIDSLTHPWKELLSEVDKLAKSKYRGNTWAAWSDGTPMQEEMIHSLLAFPGHIIASMRTHTEWTTTTDGNGKSTPIRVGLAPVQGKGIEYEFDMLMEISPDHIVNVIKDRTGKYQDQVIANPGEEFGAELVAWLAEGEVVPRNRQDLLNFARPLGLTAQDIAKALKDAHLEFDPMNWDLMTKTVVTFANGGEGTA